MTAEPTDWSERRPNLASAAQPRLARKLRELAGEAHPDQALLISLAEHMEAGRAFRPTGRARKVSVSLPEDLTAAVQRRVGRGAFSQYVSEAVARQLELDLIAELADLLEAEYGPVPQALLDEAAAAWPDVE